MIVIYLTEYNCRRYAVTFENNGCVRAQRFKDISDFKNKILCVRPLRMILGKNEICTKKEISGAYDKEKYDVNTILIKMSEENDKHRWVFISGDKVCSLLTNDDIFYYIPKMGNKVTPYSIAIGDEYMYFLTPQFKFNKREMIINNEIMNTIEKSIDPYDLHVSGCKKNSFKK